MSNNAPPSSWLSIERKTDLRGIIENRIPQWRSGARPFQMESWAYLLEGIPVIVVVPTAGGKTALFYGPILIYQSLQKNPVKDVNLHYLPPKPVALIVSPLNELGHSQVSISITRVERLATYFPS